MQLYWRFILSADYWIVTDILTWVITIKRGFITFTYRKSNYKHRNLLRNKLYAQFIIMRGNKNKNILYKYNWKTPRNVCKTEVIHYTKSHGIFTCTLLVGSMSFECTSAKTVVKCSMAQTHKYCLRYNLKVWLCLYDLFKLSYRGVLFNKLI